MMSAVINYIYDTKTGNSFMRDRVQEAWKYTSIVLAICYTVVVRSSVRCVDLKLLWLLKAFVLKFFDFRNYFQMNWYTSTRCILICIECKIINCLMISSGSCHCNWVHEYIFLVVVIVSVSNVTYRRAFCWTLADLLKLF